MNSINGHPLHTLVSHSIMRLLYLIIIIEYITIFYCIQSISTQICTTIDIRNSVRQFSKLENCSVIEGSLQISLIDNGQVSDYENLTFPKLVEITDYFFLFRVFGLVSLEKLFPNLAVIRGRKLFHDYSFVVYEMMQLHEIGLHNLMDIVRGGVRIERNPNLCFVETIDWELIAKNGKDSIFIKDNKNRRLCSTCNSEESKSCRSTFRTSGKDLAPVGDKNGRLCWNSQHCQKICSSNCIKRNSTCMIDNPNICCNENCLGGCSGHPNNCIVCKHIRTKKGNCSNNCINGFEYLNRRCIPEEECKKKTYFIEPKVEKFFKPHNGQCLPDCPVGFKEMENNPNKCVSCNGKCPKVCFGSEINSVASAQNFKGCNEIDGSLTISIGGGSNVIKELEESLKDIEEITGFLKITRSFPLISLHFFRNLKVIHGKNHILDRNLYSLIVLDNQNLQELFKWNTSKTEKQLFIKNGKIFFHINPKLCMNKILELKKYAKVADWDEEYDVSKYSNGDRIPCEVTALKLNLHTIGPSMAIIKFTNYKVSNVIADERKLLGYLIYYKPAPSKNVSLFDGRDACNMNNWEVTDIEDKPNNKDPVITSLITRLKPYTQYAIYVKTYMIAGQTQGAQSPIVYFTTKPDTPTAPIEVKSKALANDKVFIEWKKQKGNVTHYVVRVRPQPSLLDRRNYCNEPFTFDAWTNNISEEKNKVNHWLTNGTKKEDTKAVIDNEECCSCKKSLSEVELEATQKQSFEDHILNKAYYKRETDKRRRRSIPSNVVDEQAVLTSYSTSTPMYDVNVTQMPDIIFSKNVTNNFIELQNLTHYTQYSIEITACLPSKPTSPCTDPCQQCSLNSIEFVRTLPLDGADDIDSNTIIFFTENSTTTNSMFIKWEEPIQPNGIILLYEIEFKRTQSENADRVKTCILRSTYLTGNKGTTLSNLVAGTYGLRIRATSLAGPGTWTEFKTFEIKDSIAHLEYIIIIIVVVVFLIIIGTASGAYFVLKKKFGPRIPSNILYASVNPEYISAGLAYEADEWEIDRDKVKLLEELGQGSFGMVYKGQLLEFNGESLLHCAIKTVNEAASPRDRINFLQEASVMKSFNCHHVVRLLGVVSTGHPVLVCMEIMGHGDLRTYLRLHRSDEDNPNAQPPSLKQVLQMATEIADGMAYLAAKKFVHRDLAARNCMVAEDLTVKIGDFGMTRDIYETDYYRKGGKGWLPVRWMAPESLKDGVFTSQSDVWSYGVVLWEMATLAAQPYQGLANEQVLQYVINGGVMNKPEDCPERLYKLMSLCWARNPKARPIFTEIIEMLLPDVNNRFREVSFYHTQRPHILSQKAASTHEEVGPTTPLRKASFGSNDDEQLSCSDNDELDESSIKFFPTRIDNCFPKAEAEQSAQVEDEEDIIDIDNVDEFSESICIKQIKNENKGNSSDGSKGSKISSTTSNGSIANGHVLHYNTTVC